MTPSSTGPRPLRTRAIAGLCAVGLLLAACSSDSGSTGGAVGSDGGGSSQREVLSGLADDVIVPGYERLAADVDALARAIDDLCADPSPRGLDASRDAWRGAITSWQRVRPASTGPGMDQRLMSAIGFEARGETIDKLLAGDDPVDAAGLANKGANVRGLNAVEHGLFGDGSEALAASGDPGARRCGYLASVLDLSADAVHGVVDAWGRYRDEFVASTGAGVDSALSSTLNELTHRVQEIDEKALRDMAAADTYADLPSGRLDGPAAHTMAQRKALLDGVVAMLGDRDSGFAGLVADRSPDTADRLLTAADAAVPALRALPDSVEAAFDDPDAIANAASAVAELKVVLSTEVAAQLGVTITFSDADGDS